MEMHQQTKTVTPATKRRLADEVDTFGFGETLRFGKRIHEGVQESDASHTQRVPRRRTRTSLMRRQQ
jgi:hypothetical protein